jgi:MFS family permease
MKRDLTFVGLALMTWGVGEGLFFFFQPLYLQDLGANPVQIGDILSIVGVAMALAPLPAGYLSDRLGRRPMLIAAWFLGTLATLIMALAHSISIFVIGSALYGLTNFVVVPLYSYVTAARGKWSIGRALTIIPATFSLGAVLGPLLGGWLSSRAGLRSNFFIATGLFVISSLTILQIRPQPVEVPHSHGTTRLRGRMLNPKYIGFLLLICMTMFSLTLPQPLSQNFMQDVRNLNTSQIGVLIAARGIGTIVLSLLLGKFNARLGFVLSETSMALCTLLLWLGTGFPIFILGYLLMGSYQTARTLANAHGRSLVESSHMGLGFGINESVMTIAGILAPFLAGRLFAIRPSLIYSVSLVLIVLGMGISLFLLPSSPTERFPEDEEGIIRTQS